MNHDLMVNEINFDRSLIHRILNFFSVNNSIVFGNTFIMDGYLSAGSHAVFNLWDKEVNILPARTVVSPRFSNKSSQLLRRCLTK